MLELLSIVNWLIGVEDVKGVKGSNGGAISTTFPNTPFNSSIPLIPD